MWSVVSILIFLIQSSVLAPPAVVELPLPHPSGFNEKEIFQQFRLPRCHFFLLGSCRLQHLRCKKICAGVFAGFPKRGTAAPSLALSVTVPCLKTTCMVGFCLDSSPKTNFRVCFWEKKTWAKESGACCRVLYLYFTCLYLGAKLIPEVV